jgi:catechol 2,3-dioxygenase-like lactoylglutathione lyase family enzyme
MAIPAIKSATFGIAVSDLDASTKWYEQFLGSSAQSPDDGIIEFELLAGTYLMLSEASDEEPPGGSVNLQVDDVQAALAAVQQLGLTPGEVETIPEVLSYFEVKDPDGHTITLLQIMAQE